MKFILILCLFVSFHACAFQATTAQDYNNFIDSLKLNKKQIEKLDIARKNKEHKISEALETSKTLTTNKKPYLNYTLNQINKDFEQELSSFLSVKQKQKYLEYIKRVY